MPKLIVLGSSAATPFPRTLTKQFSDYNDPHYQKKFTLHDCAICARAKRGGKDRRRRSSLALLVGKKTILFDCGPDIREELRQHRLSPDAIFITHAHEDANTGIKWFQNVPIYSEERRTIRPGRAIKLYGITVQPFRVAHAANVTTVAYLVAIPRGRTTFRFVYMTDVASLRGVKKYLQPADLVFADGSILETSMNTHLSIKRQTDTYRRWRLKRVLFTHVGHSTLPHAALSRWLRARYNYVDVAFDGMKIKI